MTRTELTEQALARAKFEDAKDASLEDCALCGSRPTRMVVGQSESMSYGDSVVICSNASCGNEVRIDVYSRGASYSAAEAEASRRWNILNRKR
jgi:hypothetical protein